MINIISKLDRLFYQSRWQQWARGKGDPHISDKLWQYFKIYTQIISFIFIIFLFYFPAGERQIMNAEQTKNISQIQAYDEPDVSNLKVNPEIPSPNKEQEYKHIDESSNMPTNQSEIDQKQPTKSRNKSPIQTTFYSHQKPKTHKSSNSFTHSPKNKFIDYKRAPQRIAQEQQGEHKNYQDLTLKLETVLHKISSSSKAVNKTQSQNENMFMRFEVCEERKKKQMDRKKEEYEEIKRKQIKDKPTIDKNSLKISMEIGYKPIYLRVDALMQQKKRKQQKNQELKKQKLQQQQQIYQEQYNKHVKKPDNVRSYDQYFSEMVRWKQKRSQQNQQKLQIKKSKQLEGITFTPTLNEKSKKMISSSHRLPIQQRGLLKTKKSAAIFPKEKNPKNTTAL